MSKMNEFERVGNNLIGYLPNVIKALLLFLLAWLVATAVKKLALKLFEKINLDQKLSKGRRPANLEYGKSTMRNIAQVLYFLVFILFIPSILDALNMESVSAPITNMMNKLLAFIPNLIGAGIILFIGYFIAKIIRDLVYNLLKTINVDKWYNKLTPDLADQENVSPEDQSTLARVLANILFGIILIPIITVALETLQINTLTAPIVTVLDRVLNMIPNVFVAIILIIIGYYIAKFIGQILTALLARMGIQKVFSWIDRKSTKGIPRFDLASAIGTIVKVIIMLFIVVEALRIVRLEVLNTIGNAIIAYIPLLLSGLIIIGLGVFAGYFVEGMIRKYTNSSLSGAILKYIIIIFAIFMTLEQIRFASTIVNIAFLLVLGGLSVAFAIAFGVGGRDFAKKQLQKFEEKIEKDEKKPTTENKPNIDRPNMP
jgi:hypothetical protein